MSALETVDYTPLEDMMGQIGDFGRYQLFQHCLHLLASFFAGIHMLSLSFTAATPNHRCHVPELDGNKPPKYDSSYKLNKTMMANYNKYASDPRYYPDYKKANDEPRCNFYATPGTNTSIYDSTKKAWNLTTGTKEEYCKSFEFNFTYYEPTSYVVQYEMICNSRVLKANMKSIYMFGVLVGVISLGPLADKIGRKPIFCISAMLQVVFGVSLAFITNYYVHLFMLWVHGIFASGGAYVTAFVLTMELVGGSKRTTCGTNFSMAFTAGCLLLVLTAYFIRNAVYFQITISCYAASMLGHWWLCDESIRWLWGKGRRKEAIRICKKAARWNKRPFEDRYSDLPATVAPSVFDATERVRLNTEGEGVNTEGEGVNTEGEGVRVKTEGEDVGLKTEGVGVNTKIERVAKQAEKTSGLVDLFKYPRLRIRLLFAAFNWFANSIVYYGISFNTQDLIGDPYENFLYSTLAEIPGFIIVLVCVPYTGSRTMMACNLGFGGLMCYICIALEKGTAVNVLSIVAKIAIAVSFTIVYNYTAELFPTVARNSAVGFCSMAARLAGMSTPYLALLDEFYGRFPVVIFGTVAIVGAIMCAFLPETLHTELPQTMEDGENFMVGDTAFTECLGCFRNRRYKKDQDLNTNTYRMGSYHNDNLAASVDAPSENPPESDVVATE